MLFLHTSGIRVCFSLKMPFSALSPGAPGSVGAAAWLAAEDGGVFNREMAARRTHFKE